MIPRGAPAGLVAAVLAAVPATAPAAAGEHPDAGVLQRIAAVRSVAARVRIDGRAGDWKGVPSFADADPLPVEDRSRDIVRVAAAPLDDAILVLVETAGPPSREPGAFTVDLDFRGLGGRDASLRIDSEMRASAMLYAERGAGGAMPVGVLAAWKDVLEVRVPLAALELGGEAPRRSFARVQVSSHRSPPPPRPGGPRAPGEPPAVPGAPVLVDEGPAAASFFLSSPAPDLDPPVLPGSHPRRAVPPPLEGKWFVRQGAMGLWTHQDLHAYDLSLVDAALRPTGFPGSRRLEDYPAFGRAVRAPEAGTIVFDTAPQKDRPPLEAGAGRDGGNALVLRLADGLRLQFCHLREGSVSVKRGDAVAEGERLAEIGNSGDSGAPHLHLSLHERPGEFVGLPLAFRKVRVGLNPGADDPWARDLEEWPVREGWFVEAR